MKAARISREFEGADLGDPRRSRRLVRVAERPAAAPERTLSGACGGWDETMAAYRLLAAPQVTPEKILAPHRRALLERAASESALAVIQDTTQLDFTRMKHMQGNGPLNEEKRRGLLLLPGEISFELPAKTWMKKLKGSRVQTSRSARTVRPEVRAMAVRPRPPYRKGKRLPALTIWAVLAKEVDPPEGEEPVCWILLTSCEVTTFAAAKRIIAFYLRRWDIEVFHRTLKTGCRAEQLQLKGSQAVRNALAIYIITAWRILYLTHLARVSPQLPCSTVFAAEEWQAACAVARPGKAAPRDPPALGEFLSIVAHLGGHLGRKSDGPPGAQTIWQGLVRMRDFACAWRALHSR